MIRERQRKFYNVYVKSNIIGTCLCILAPVILLIGVFTEDPVATIVSLSVMLVIIGIAVYVFVSVGVKWASMERLLQEREFSKKGKEQSKTIEAIKTVCWLLTTAIYLGWSFWANDWHITWMVWPIAGVIFAALMVIMKYLYRKKDR